MFVIFDGSLRYLAFRFSYSSNFDFIIFFYFRVVVFLFFFLNPVCSVHIFVQKTYT